MSGKVLTSPFCAAPSAEWDDSRKTSFPPTPTCGVQAELSSAERLPRLAQETPKLRWTFPAVPFRQETSDTVCTFSISPF